MSELKTKPNDASVVDFLNRVPEERKRRDAFTLLELFQQVTGEPPRMWGDSIVGFGSYHYKSERSRQEGDWPRTAFSPRKQSLTLYLSYGIEAHAELLGRLGKHKTGKGCLYINKLEDVDLEVLRQLVTEAYQVAPT